MINFAFMFIVQQNFAMINALKISAFTVHQQKPHLCHPDCLIR